MGYFIAHRYLSALFSYMIVKTGLICTVWFVVAFGINITNNAGKNIVIPYSGNVWLQ